MTGVDAPYEPPQAPDLRLAAGERPPDELARAVVAHLDAAGFLAPP